MTRVPFRVLVLVGAVCLGAVGAARAEDERPAPPPAHTDAQVAPALEAYRRDFAESDMDRRLKAVRALARWRHKEVLKELKRVLAKEADLELKAAAAEGFQHQTSFGNDPAKPLAEHLKQWKDWASQEESNDPAVEERTKYEARVLAAIWVSVGALGWKEPWKDWKGYIDHPHDDVAAAAITAFGRMKEYRALAPLLEWFNIYPDGITWEGGSVRVDTGAAGDKDQKAAEAAWKAKYGGRKKKARPGVVDALLKAVKDITGQEFTKPAELKQWMEDNKLLLRKHGA
jgi:hypothetical protein